MALHQKQVWKRRYSAEIKIDADYADDIVLLTNTSTQARIPAV